MVEKLTQAYRIILFCTFLYAVIVFRRADQGTKLICLLVCLGFLTELSARISVAFRQSNHLIYNISFYAEFLLITLYYNATVDTLKRKNAGIYIAVACIVPNMIYAVLFLPLGNILNVDFLFFECLIVVCLSLYAIYRLVSVEDDNLRLEKKLHFWFPFVLLFYQCAALGCWGLYDQFGDNEAEKAAGLDMTVLVVNIITYLSYGVLFYLSSEIKSIDVPY